MSRRRYASLTVERKHIWWPNDIIVNSLEISEREEGTTVEFKAS
jgi:hypothetical protein